MKTKYDVAIIGSGIGGLVCGCYLVNAGLKVLIVEKHNKPGGYCTSFKKGGFSFDVGVHYLGGIRKAVLGSILRELELIDKIEFNQFDPTDKIIMPNNVSHIRANSQDTIEEFKKSFPNERGNIVRFFKFIMQKDPLLIYTKVKKLTFQDLLDNFFADYRLKATLGILLGNIGSSPKFAPAFISIIMFRQYILDPGYYPSRGIQTFPDALVQYFKKKGGDLLLLRKVVKIITNNDRAEGIILEDGCAIKADTVVSNVDATQTFKELLKFETKESIAVEKLIPAPSLFLLYLGLNKKIKNSLNGPHNIWFFLDYDVDKIYSNIKENILKDDLPWIVCSFPSIHDKANNSDKLTAEILFYAPYETEEFWNEYRNTLAEKMLCRMNKLIPGFDASVELKFTATPFTFFKYTLNKNGSFVGWLPSVHQPRSSRLPQISSVKGLYLVGTWCTVGYPGQGGIPNVAASGRRGAMLILKNLGKDWTFSEIKL